MWRWGIAKIKITKVIIMKKILLALVVYTLSFTGFSAYAANSVLQIKCSATTNDNNSCPVTDQNGTSQVCFSVVNYMYDNWLDVSVRYNGQDFSCPQPMKTTGSSYVITFTGVSQDDFYSKKPILKVFDEDTHTPFVSILAEQKDQNAQRTCQQSSNQKYMICPITSH